MGAHGEPGSNIPSRERVEPGSVNITPFTAFPPTVTSEDVDASKIAQDLVCTFNDALSKKDFSSVAKLFLKDNGFWKDHLALNWELRTLQGQDKILNYLKNSKNSITKLEIDGSASHKAPKIDNIDAWGDVKGVQCFVRFETEIGRGQGVLSLAEEKGVWKIFVLSTVLKELKGHEEPVGHRRTKGVQHGGNPGRKNWRETREAEANFEGTEPRVLIIGM
jgi:hypothetical protein